MAKASWNKAVLAESEHFEMVDRNIYFPPDTVDEKYLKKSDTHTICPWKGTASYYDIEVDGKTNKDAAWYYPETKDKAKNIEGYVAFWKGVEVSE